MKRVRPSKLPEYDKYKKSAQSKVTGPEQGTGGEVAFVTVPDAKNQCTLVNSYANKNIKL